MQKVIFEHEYNKYELVLEVTDQFNDYHQQVFTAQLKLYTFDNMLIACNNYLFPVKVDRYKNVQLALDFYLDHLQGRYLPSTLAYDLYLEALREGSEIAKNL